jgi:hypothetical protein
MSNYKVLGYIKNEKDFRTIAEWELIANEILQFQKEGYDTRAGSFRCARMLECSTEIFSAFKQVVNDNFGYLYHDVERFENVDIRNFFNFIEDFVNYRVWTLRHDFETYFSNINKLRFAFFYTRDDIEPYVMIDDEFTLQAYGTVYNPKTVYHYATSNGAKNIANAIAKNQQFDISCFTVAERPFFRKQSNVLIKLEGNVRAGFKSDIKSFAVNNGRRACNLYRLGYPDGTSNLCYELDTCDAHNLTSLWNEYITTPIHIIAVEMV